MSTYEKLSGEQGRRIYYRAERFPAQALFEAPAPTVELGEDRFELRDLSMTGLGLTGASRQILADKVGTEVDYRVRQDDDILLEGRARISRVERQPQGILVGLGVESAYLDLPNLVERQRGLRVRREMDRLASPADGIDPAYKLLVADVLDMFRRYESLLSNALPKANGKQRPDRNHIDDLLDLCEERIIPEWRSLWHRANELVMPIMGDSDALRAVKQYTERNLTPEFVAGPIWRRAYEKPLGYPGDFRLMDQVYGWRREGDTPFAMLVHRLGLEVAECIATRMVMVQQTIADIVAQDGRAGAVHITSLGCGPAQEVRNFLGMRQTPRPVAFTLIDQEKEALAHAYEKTYPLTLAHGGAARVTCLHISFMDLLKKKDPFQLLAPQDMIYSVGLVDYLAPRRAGRLVDALYRRLAPGGTMIIGNMHDTPTGNQWPMEVICDWSLHYRNERQMLALAEGLGAERVEIRPDPTGRVLLMFLRKP